jgi:AbrB family looped-hinge helix DNA binding protein
MPRTTISSKYQITLPARLIREMGLQPGDQLAVERKGLAVILHPRPKDWVTYTAGTMKGTYGRTRQEVDAYIEELRGEWGEVLEPLSREEEPGSAET